MEYISPDFNIVEFDFKNNIFNSNNETPFLPVPIG